MYVKMFCCKALNEGQRIMSERMDKQPRGETTWTNYPEEAESPSNLKRSRVTSWSSGSKLGFIEDGRFSVARAAAVGHPM